MASSRLVLVAATIRTSTLNVRLLPSRPTSLSWITRRSFACNSGRSAEISSRKSVPPLACSNLPMLRVCAPVNEPFSWPNSWLSISSLGMAAQLMATNGLLLRLPCWCKDLAMSSLPVPLSPVIRTELVVLATLSMSCKISSTAGSWLTISSSPYLWAISERR